MPYFPPRRRRSSPSARSFAQPGAAPVLPDPAPPHLTSLLVDADHLLLPGLSHSLVQRHDFRTWWDWEQLHGPPVPGLRHVLEEQLVRRLESLAAPGRVHARRLQQLQALIIVLRLL